MVNAGAIVVSSLIKVSAILASSQSPVPIFLISVQFSRETGRALIPRRQGGHI